jgi:hypothetical protein
MFRPAIDCINKQGSLLIASIKGTFRICLASMAVILVSNIPSPDRRKKRSKYVDEI